MYFLNIALQRAAPYAVLNVDLQGAAPYAFFDVKEIFVKEILGKVLLRKFSAFFLETDFFSTFFLYNKMYFFSVTH